MPHTPTTPALPFQGSTLTSRHCSAQAAVTAADTRAWKTDRYMAWLLTVECATDHTAADHFDWPISTICSIRNGLFKRGDIAVHSTEIGKYGARCTRWKASDEARRKDRERAAGRQGAA